MTAPSIAVVYFTATDVTGTYARTIAEELVRLGAAAQLVDVTPFAARQAPLDLSPYAGVIWGVPTYGDFSPSVLHDWLPALAGNGQRCALFVTYGGRTPGYTHYHTAALLAQAGFHLVLSGEFLGPHTYNVAGWTALPDRPNANDLATTREFAGLALQRLTDPDARRLILQKPCAYDLSVADKRKRTKSGERGMRHPLRDGGCSMCRRCQTECPAAAFDAEAGLSDPLKCIECMHCVFICPDQVLHIGDGMAAAYPGFLEGWNLTDEMMRAKRSKIIAESWQATF